MALVLADRVNETTTTAGTGTLTLAGAVSGYQSFSVIGNANTTYYTIVHQTANEWEVGIGTYTSAGTTLSRDTVLASSAGGTTKVTFSAGTKFVFCDYPAGKAIYQDASGNTYVPNLGATTASSAVVTTLTATGQTSLGGAAGSEGLRVLAIASAAQLVNVRSNTAGGSGPVISASSATDTDVNLIVGAQNAGAIRFSTARASDGTLGADQFRVSHTASAVNYVQATGAATTVFPAITVQGSDTNIGLSISSKGTQSIRFNNNNNVNQIFRIDGTSSAAVNYLQVTGTNTAIAPILSAQGTDTNVGLNIQSKGTGAINFQTAGGTTQLAVTDTASAVNYVQVTGSATGNDPVISAQGSDASRNLRLTAKGTGAVQSTTRFEAATASANYLVLTGAATTLSPTFSMAGSDTNISMVFQPKGTGAIDLAAGSSGVNISNGGTVTALTRTAAGTGYTSPPTVNISAPTTAGGVQATATTTLLVVGISIVNGGTGYTVGDTLTLSGGTSAITATFTVSAVSGGVITAVAGLNNGAYSVIPANPVSVTGGTGSGATFNLTWGVGAGSGSNFTITNAGSGYVEQPTVSFSGGGGAGAAAYASVGGIPVFKSLNNVLSFNVASGEALRINNQGFSTLTDYVEVQGGASVAGAYIGVNGSTATASLYASAKGGGAVRFFTNGQGVTEQFRVAHTASAVNYVQVTGNVTTGPVVLSSQGSDTNVSAQFNTKGTGGFSFFSSAGTYRQFRVDGTNNAVNYLQVAGNIASSAPALSSQGSDTNIDLTLTPKGTGKVVVTNGIQGGSF